MCLSRQEGRRSLVCVGYQEDGASLVCVSCQEAWPAPLAVDGVMAAARAVR